MTNPTRAAAALFALSFAAGCAPPAPSTDVIAADASMPDVTTTPDVREAAAPLPLFSACTTDRECGTGRTCNTTFSGGLCTRACRRDMDCGDTGWCYRNACIPQCNPGGNECAPWSGLCFFWDSAMQDKRGCFPGCSENPAMGEPRCVAGRTCNPYSGECETSPNLEGGRNGDPCMGASDCAGGRCRAETTDTPMPETPTGYLGGYCFSVTRRPAQAAFMRGQPLPRGGCPMGSVIIPFTGDAEGDPVSCWKECRADMDCRAGYYCNRVINSGMPVYTTGGCMPVNCLTTGMSCPAGTRCVTRTSGSTRFGVCTPDGDAGVPDAGADASAPTDGGARPDGSADGAVAPADAGTPPADAGTPPADAGATDASAAVDAASTPDAIAPSVDASDDGG
jgi:hypothetical protein